MSVQNSNRKQSRPSKHNPEVLELAVDVATFHRKWPTKRLAKLAKVTRQSVDYHVDKKLT